MISTISIWGGQFIACDRGDGYLRKLEDFETDPQIHRNFLEMTPIKFNFCASSPHPIAVEIACVQTSPPQPHRFFLRGGEVVCKQATVEATNIPATNRVVCRTDVIFHVFQGK